MDAVVIPAIVHPRAPRVLNATDIAAYAQAMAALPCPDPMARAPRANGKIDYARLYLAPPTLHGAVAAIVSRDTRGPELSDAQRLSHFPATPLVSLSWFHGMDVGMAEPGGWQPFGAAIMLSGSQSRPGVSWTPTGGRSGMACFPADAAQALFGLDLAALHDRFVPAHAVLNARWQQLLAALAQAGDDAATLAALEHHLAEPWQALQAEPSPMVSLRRLGRHWVERLAWQAYQWRRTLSPRQVERRILAHSGRSLRQWQSLVRTEGAFFAARERHAAGQPFDWAGLAQDEGFADQAHLCRETKRITGFSPSDFARRYIEDESFWLYRIWI